MYRTQSNQQSRLVCDERGLDPLSIYRHNRMQLGRLLLTPGLTVLRVSQIENDASWLCWRMIGSLRFGGAKCVEER